MAKCVGSIDDMVSLNQYIDTTKMAVRNADSKTSLSSVVGGRSTGVLSSETDAQLLIVVPFREKVKLRGVRFVAHDKDNGPKSVRLFVDKPNLSFSDATKGETHAFSIDSKDLNGNEQKVKFAKFQSVSEITIFIESNQSDGDVTVLNGIEFIGCPIIHEKAPARGG